MFWFAVELFIFLLITGVVFFTAGWLMGWKWGRKSQVEGVAAGDAKLSLQNEFREMLVKHQEAFRQHHDRVMNALQGVRSDVEASQQETVQRAQQVIQAMPAESNFEGILSSFKMPSMPDYASSFSAIQKRMDAFNVKVPDYSTELAQLRQKVENIRFEAPDYSEDFAKLGNKVDAIQFEAPDYSADFAKLGSKVDGIQFESPDYSANFEKLGSKVDSIRFEAPDYSADFAKLGNKVDAIQFEAPDYTSHLSSIGNKVDSMKVEVPNYNRQFAEVVAEIKRVKTGVDATMTETKTQAKNVIAAIPAPVKAVQAAPAFDYKVVNTEIHTARKEAQAQTNDILSALSAMKAVAAQVKAPAQSGERRDYTPLLNEIAGQIKPLHGMVDEIETLQAKYGELTAKLSSASVVTEVDTKEIEDKLDHIYYILEGAGVKTARTGKREVKVLKPVVRKKKVAKTASSRKSSRKSSKAKKRMDDLKRIKGIGRVIERQLNSNGVHTFQDIANWKGKDVGYFENKLHFKGRIGREKWINQAKKLFKKAG